MTEWIKCSDRMPEGTDNVLFYDQWDTCDHRIKCGAWTDRYWRPNAETGGDGYIESYPPVYVTHWMPLPSPPEVE